MAWTFFNSSLRKYPKEGIGFERDIFLEESASEAGFRKKSKKTGIWSGYISLLVRGGGCVSKRLIGKFVLTNIRYKPLLFSRL